MHAQAPYRSRPAMHRHVTGAADEPAKRLRGSIESIVFRNEQTGYTVLTLKLETNPGLPVTLVGHCAAAWVGESVSADGRWTQHPRHGRQFQADQIRCEAPTSAEGIRRYLASGMIRGIGKVNAQRLVDRFGAETLNVIEKASARLEEVEGIGPVRRERIKASWNAQRGTRDIMIFLQANGVGTAQSARIYRQYGDEAVALIKQNPYRLCRDIWGIGFKTADAIAQRVGIPPDSEVRAKAGLTYQLERMADEGHCYLPRAQLLLESQALLGMSVDRLAEALAAEVETGRLILERERVYLPHLYTAERRVAERLRRLLDTPVAFRPLRVASAVAWAESHMGIRLTETQREALRTALGAKVSVITGGPGVGKTTIIRAIAEIFRARRLPLFLAAPTGRAAKRMSEATGITARTIHRLLKYNPRSHSFDHNADHPLEAVGIVLDEASMIDIRLMVSVVEALPDSAMLILVGDIDQLPSVGPGNVLGDIIRASVIPCRTLNTIFRQDASGLIVRNAHLINQGEFVQNGGEDSDFFFIRHDDPEQVLAITRELVTTRIPKRFGLDPLRDIQVLTPMRRNLLGADNLNTVLQAALNPDGPSLERFGSHYRAGDRVMQIRNNYDKEVFNGDIGWIRQVDEEDQTLVVEIDGRPLVYDRDELDELTLAYASSIHKAQGSEYPAVVVLMATQHFKLLQRNLIYTAITRARKLVCLVGSPRAVGMAIRNRQHHERYTTLAERLSRSDEN